MKKTLLIGVAILAAAVIGVSVWLFTSLDSIIKAAIEKYGSEITGVSVALDGVRLSPAADEGLVSGLRIGNPQGFKTPQAVSVGSIDIAFDRASLARDVVLIHRIAVASPRVSYEAGSGGRSNFDVIQHNVEQHLGKEPRQVKSAGKKLIVEHLEIRDIKVTYTPILLEGKGFEISLPDIELRDLGKAKGGLTPGELAKAVTEALMTRMTRAITNTLKGAADVTRSVTESVKGIFGK
jgi:uncharacterized protein involved in outer membrane biogenesis